MAKIYTSNGGVYQMSKEAADAFKDNILTKGNIVAPDILYRNFRGRDPRPEALMEKLGMSDKK